MIFFFFLIILLLLFLTEHGMIEFTWSGFVCERELCYGAWASCPYKQLTSQDAGSLLCLMKADFH